MTENTQQEYDIHQHVTWDTPPAPKKEKREKRQHFTGNYQF